MRRIGLAALLTLSFLAPLAAEEKTAGKIARIGIIGTFAVGTVKKSIAITSGA